MNARIARRARALSARAALSLAALIAACNPYEYTQSQPDIPEAPLDQAGRGEKIYASTCAGCHGEKGEGTEDRPAFIGENALPEKPRAEAQSRKTELHTAQDLFEYIKSDMPPIAPGSLSDDEVWALVAFQRRSSGAPVRGDLGPQNAASINLR
jgi:mono/diheme cytochrome c family protein